MSHFSVLVITPPGPRAPSQDELSRILMPWHEYECTGHKEYLQDVDMTEEVTTEFNKPRPAVRLAEGGTFSRYDERFWERDAEGQLQFKLPKGAYEVELPASQAAPIGVGPRTLADQAGEDGYFERDGRFYRRTNPNAKWDWWQVGGRWTGMLVPHYDPDRDPTNRETCWLCAGTGKRKDREVQDGCNGCRGTGIMTKWPTRWRSVGDQARVGDIPLEALRNIAEKKALIAYDQAHKAIGTLGLPARADLEAARYSEESRQKYWAHPGVRTLKAALGREGAWLDVDQIEELRANRAEVATRARRRAIQTFAVVKDGQWYARGEMGWWATVSGEKDQGDWSEEFSKLLDGLSPDTWVTVVDCHI